MKKTTIFYKEIYLCFFLMQGIFTTCISREIIDESPMAYKPMDEIVNRITPTAEIVSTVKPLYNFKAGGE